MTPALDGTLLERSWEMATVFTTPLSLLLLGLTALNLAALLRPVSLLSRAVGAALLLPLLLLLALPLPGSALGPLLQAAIPLLVLLLLTVLLQEQPNAHGGELPQPLASGPSSASAAPTPTQPQHGRLYVATAIAASLAIALLLALRPYPFEYPGDSTDYWQGFIQAQLEPSPPRSCMVEGLRQPTYQRFCTLWSVVLQAGHLVPSALLSGIPQRLTIALEVTVLGLSSFRLLQASKVGAAAAALSWLLVAFGLGNQAIAFLVNHALQGSILAAAIFLEAVMVMLRLLLWRTSPLLQAGSLVAALLVFLLLAMKLHGAFALCTLVLVVPLLSLIGIARLGGHWKQPLAFSGVSRASARWLLIASLGLMALTLTMKTGWLLNKRAEYIVPWSFVGWLGVPSHALPGSYLMRAPGSRPETLAVAGILIGIVHLSRNWRPGCRGAAEPRPHEPQGGSDPSQAEASLYALAASLYGVAVLVVFLLPPFSHLFLNIPYEVTSNYRLMWGCILFSPLPCLLLHGLSGRRLPASLAALIMAVVLIPVPGGSARSPQLFWSKSPHLLQGPSARVDLMAIAAALIPPLATAPAQEGLPPVVLADELIASSLAPWTGLVRPTHPIRVYNRADLSDPRKWDTQAPLRQATSDSARLQVLASLESRPTLVVQQRPFDAAEFYSPYSEILVYDRDIVSLVSATSVNALSPTVLRAAGFELWKRLDSCGRTMPAAASQSQDVYWIWRRNRLP
ncbi:hypothetical protein H6G65_12375 [Microcystis elabens FACHB-917]|nr:hypothetical protein [Microcystis elabens FACHB-917]